MRYAACRLEPGKSGHDAGWELLERLMGQLLGGIAAERTLGRQLSPIFRSSSRESQG